MKKIFRTFNAFIKGLVLLFRPHWFLGWVSPVYLLFYNTISLSRWLSKQDKKGILNDFYSPKRNYSKRLQLYTYVLENKGLKEQSIDYLEFGVFGGSSFGWWLKNNINSESRFYGFDTFEGLPENWGTFKKGEMNAEVPTADDSRAKFIKGLFQDTLHNFLKEHNLENGKKKVIHMDADLFSSTLFTLTTLAPFLKKGDIIFFDEFNVPNHEFYAFQMFCKSYYVKTRMIGAVNNYFQVAIEII